MGNQVERWNDYVRSQQGGLKSIPTQRSVPADPWKGFASEADRQAESIRLQNETLRAQRGQEAKDNSRGEVSPLGGLARGGFGARAVSYHDHLHNNLVRIQRSKPR